MPIVHDLNSGMRVFRTNIARENLALCPDSFAFCDIITLVFISQKRLVLEVPVAVAPRRTGASSANTRTAFETVMEITNMLVLFNPMRIFLPVSIICVVCGAAWGFITIISRKEGLSVASMLVIMVGVISFFLGLIAEQLSALRKSQASANSDPDTGRCD